MAVQCKLYKERVKVYSTVYVAKAVQHKLYNAQCKLYNVDHKVYNVQCKLYNVEHKLYNVQCNCVLCVNCIMYTTV